jgi:hypothetical protein
MQHHITLLRCPHITRIIRSGIVIARLVFNDCMEQYSTTWNSTKWNKGEPLPPTFVILPQGVC